MNRRQRRNLLVVLLFVFLIGILLAYQFFILPSMSNNKEHQPAENTRIQDIVPEKTVEKKDSEIIKQTEDKTINQPEIDVNEVTKNIAESFVKSYMTYNAKEPLSYLENSKQFMTDEFYNEKVENPRRQEISRPYTKYLSGEFFPVQSRTEDERIWNMSVSLEDSDDNGNKKLYKTCVWVTLQGKDENWKVSDFMNDGGCP
ncbi:MULTISPECIES: hypothetical protein [Bacillota]|uniref:hypothetical protein n=1 Tax=Bacillota TaxID=1239 RepID=UPI0039EF8372